MSKSRQVETLAEGASPEMIAAAAAARDCRSVAFTYHDPVIFPEYAVDTAQACHARGIKTVAVTAGYVSPEPRTALYRHTETDDKEFKSPASGHGSDHMRWGWHGAKGRLCMDAAAVVLRYGLFVSR